MVFSMHTQGLYSYVTVTCVEQWSEGSSGRAVERWTVNRADDGSIPPSPVSKLRQFRSPHSCETLKASGPFYLVSIPRKVKHSTQGVNV